jgi:hypothetical protein
MRLDRRPPTADRRPPTADRRPPTADRRPPTADRRPPTADPILIPSPGRVRHSAAGGGGARENSQKLIEL